MSAAASATASAQGSAAEELVRMPGLDASIHIPPGWTSLSYSDVGDGFDEARQSYPAAAEMLDAAERQMQEGSVRFVAFETKPGGDNFFANVSVGRVPGVPPSAEEVADEIAASIQDEVDVKGKVEAGTARVEAGEVAVVTYVVQGQQPPDVWVTQFAYPRETDGLILTLAAPENAVERYTDTWQQIADSVTF